MIFTRLQSRRGIHVAQSSALEPAAVFVPHLIQDRTDAEMRALAEKAVEDVLAALASV
jgi:hypothetical protein